jgi:hypothetical protein
MNFDQLVTRKCIDLSFNSLHDGNIDVLVEVIQKTTVLQALNLWGNRIALDDDKLTDAIAQNSTIRVLSIGSNDIGSEGGKRLAAALGVNTSIVELHMGDNRIGDEGATHLADALSSNGTIGLLGVYGNAIGDVGAKSLAASFRANKGLRGIWLHENRIGEEGSRDLVEAVRENRGIESVFLLNEHDADILAILNDPGRKSEASEEEAAAETAEASEAKVEDEVLSSIQNNEELLKEISSKDAEIAKLKAALELKNEDLKAKNEEIAALRAVIENSTQVIASNPSIKEMAEIAYDDARDEMDVVGDVINLQPLQSME